MRNLHHAVLVSTLVVTAPAAAIERIPEESGFSGFLTLGVAGNWVKSNMVAGTFFGDVADKKIDSVFDDPDSKTSVSPLINYDLRYTFAGTRTQLFLGQQILDAVRYDFTNAVGVRQELPDQSIVEAGYLRTTLPTKVWQDPYVEGQSRKKSEREATGFRVGWDHILGSGLNLRYTYQDIDIDDEDSGQFLGLSAADRSLLDRNGELNRVEAIYNWKLGDGHTVTPALYYAKNNLDGDAMKQDSYGLQLTYTYRQPKEFTVIANGYLGRSDYDARNPIYGKKQEDDNYGLGVTYFHHGLLGVSDLSGVVGLATYGSDSNIDFYDAQLVRLTLAGLYSF
jgi:hypothetical protein